MRLLRRKRKEPPAPAAEVTCERCRDDVHVGQASTINGEPYCLGCYRIRMRQLSRQR